MMRGFVGKYFHSPAGKLECLQKCLVCIDEKGIIIDVIEHCKDPDRFDHTVQELKENNLLEVRDEKFCFLPGFVDLHVHAPQYPNMGTGLYLPLEEWLERITFPLEASFKDPAQARAIYPDLVKTLLSNGTTCVLYFSSIHADATIELAKICLEVGQRAFVGKVCMDNVDQCPDYYIEQTEESLSETQRVIHSIHELSDKHFGISAERTGKNISDCRLVRPVITPRFVPSCTDALLEGLGKLAESNPTVIVQSHCSESNWAVEYSKERFEGKTDCEVYHHFGLLRKNSIWAHSIYLTDCDLLLLSGKGAGVAHCPLSNFYFANAAFPYKRVCNADVNVGLGTDISGGYSPSLYENCRLSVVASLALRDGINPDNPQRGSPGSRITIEESFYMATMGGAKSLGISHLIGSFEVGKSFDAQLVQLPALIPSNSTTPQQETEVFEKMMHSTNEYQVKQVWVAGKLVHSK